MLACSMFVLPLTHTAIGLLSVGIGIGFGNSFINPSINGLASRSVNKHWQGRVLGLMQAAASLGRFVRTIAWRLAAGFQHQGHTGLWQDTFLDRQRAFGGVSSPD